MAYEMKIGFWNENPWKRENGSFLGTIKYSWIRRKQRYDAPHWLHTLCMLCYGKLQFGSENGLHKRIGAVATCCFLSFDQFYSLFSVNVWKPILKLFPFMFLPFSNIFIVYLLS